MYEYLLTIVGAKHALALPLSQSMTLHSTVLNNFKKVKKNISTLFRKRKRLRKISLIANNLIKKIVIRNENR